MTTAEAIRTRSNAQRVLDFETYTVLRQGGHDMHSVAPEDFEGIGYEVAMLWDGALEETFQVTNLAEAEGMASRLAGHYGLGSDFVAIVSEVYISGDLVEPTGYMADRTFHG